MDREENPAVLDTPFIALCFVLGDAETGESSEQASYSSSNS